MMYVLIFEHTLVLQSIFNRITTKNIPKGIDVLYFLYIIMISNVNYLKVIFRIHIKSPYSGIMFVNTGFLITYNNI